MSLCIQFSDKKKKNKAKIDCLLDFGFVLEQYEVMQESFLSVEF